jgi:hypothetical protein
LATLVQCCAGENVKRGLFLAQQTWGERVM